MQRIREEVGLIGIAEWDVEAYSQGTYLSPTYDHASCLGRELLEPKRQQYLQDKQVSRYIKKSMSAFYEKVNDKKPLPTLTVFQKASEYSPEAAFVWLSKLEEVTDEMTMVLLNRLPSERVATTAINFAQQVLIMNKERLQNK